MNLLIEISPVLLRGAYTTVLLTLVSGTCALLVGFAVGLARLARTRWLSIPLAIYIEVFRNTSSLVQIFYFFFVLPLIGIRLEAFTTGCLVLALNFGAYISEVVRSAILSIDRGQHDATIALNMPTSLSYRRIIIPQAIPVMLPAFGNYALELLKATSLVSLITITELTFSGAQLVQYYGHPTLIYMSIFVIYLLLALPLVALNKALERHSGGQWKPKVPTT
ncbi:amino acid ABC transporter permease [Bosea sp. 2RAB26]|uniref:amino acid ABC transporter permease n=1 Tax=Bosea sp. 2RAB26 TaxID=3237476 RepID=UPI003F912E06